MASLSTTVQASHFTANPVEESDLEAMRKSQVLTEACPVDPKRLHRLTFSYIDFEGGEHHDGEMVVLDAVAPYVLKIFQKLHRCRFPIAKINLMNAYGGDDERALADNNSSGFCDRALIGNCTLPSLHAYGLAFDINPIQNPYIEMDEKQGTAQFKPAAGIAYANRKLKRPGKEYRPGMAEEIVELCYTSGFTVWGGNWDTPIDYQHFQTTRPMAELLAAMSSEHAVKFFKDCVENPALFQLMENRLNSASLAESYTNTQEQFLIQWEELL